MHQTHPNIRIVVVDGGSTDSTPKIIREEYPHAFVLTSKQTLWWGGATRRGIDWAFENGAEDRDFVLMVNNDTRFDADLLEYLIETSCKYQAAVGGVVVSSDDPDEVIDGGITLDWQGYKFSTVKATPDGTNVKLNCDVLPGRSTLVPIWAINKAGNIDDKSFPHYIADYEFTHRLKRTGGICLAVDYRAKVRTRVTNTRMETNRRSVREAWRNVSSQRSKSNFLDHLRFVNRHAPNSERLKIVVRLVLARTPLRQIVRIISRSRALLRFTLSFSTRLGRVSIRLLFGTYLIHAQDCERFNLDATELCKFGVLRSAGYPDYFILCYGLRKLRLLMPQALPLYWWAWSPHIKVRAYWTVRFKTKDDLHV